MKHPVPSITATMEEMPERHTLAGQIMVSLDILCVSIDLKVYFLCPVIIQFHPLPPQWRRSMPEGTREASSSIHYRHNGGDARKAHVKHPVPSITATMEEMPERHTCSIQFHPLPPQWRGCQKGTREASSSIYYCNNGGDARKAHVRYSKHCEPRNCVFLSYSITYLCPAIDLFHPPPPLGWIYQKGTHWPVKL